MNLNEQQQQALQHARDVTAEAPQRPGMDYADEWYQTVRRALADVVAAFPADYSEQPPPDAGDSDPGSAS